MTDWVTEIIDRLGFVGVAFLVALENVFPPIPSEVILPLAGYVAGRGDANFLGMVAAASVGSLVGAWILYGLSAAIGPSRMHRFIHTYGRWLGVKEADLIRAENWFDRRATYAVLFGRCVPLIRSIVSIPAGFRRMPIGRFTLTTIVGSLVWNLALIGGGALLGDRWEELGDYVAILQWLVVVVVVAAAGWFIWTRLIFPRLANGRTAAAPDDSTN